MRHSIAGFLCLCFLHFSIEQAQSREKIDGLLPVRGLAIAAPTAQSMEPFLKFIENELVPAHFNLLILRVDWNFAYESHPELRSLNPLSKSDVKKIVEACKKHNIKIAPQLNLLGHQSWGKTTHSLLREYPQFDETPHVKTENYTDFPNPDGLYVKILVQYMGDGGQGLEGARVGPGATWVKVVLNPELLVNGKARVMIQAANYEEDNAEKEQTKEADPINKTLKVTKFFLTTTEYIGPTSSVQAVASSSSLKVYSIAGGLVIEGTEKATVYGVDGSVIATATGNIALPKGLYIVKVGNKAVKAVVK